MNPLPYILSILTGTRQKVVPGVDFEWSRNSWVHNIFRVYELIFWRKYGVKAESTTTWSDGKVTHYFHTWESVFAYTETYLRNIFKFKFVKVYIPSFAGVNQSVSPYLFAVAFDAVSEAPNIANVMTAAHTATGSNLTMVFGCFQQKNPNPGYSSIVWNTTQNLTAHPNEPVTRADGVIGVYFRYLFNPATGSANLVATAAGAVDDQKCHVCTYSGTNQSALDSTNFTAYGTSAGITLTTTVVTDQSWTVGFERNDVGGESDGAGTTHRGTQGDHSMNDSNGGLSPGSRSLIKNFGSTTCGGLIVSLAPAGGGTTNHFLTILGVGL